MHPMGSSSLDDSCHADVVAGSLPRRSSCRVIVGGSYGHGNLSYQGGQLDVDQPRRRSSLDNSCLSSINSLLMLKRSSSVRSNNPLGGSSSEFDEHQDYNDPMSGGLDNSSHHHRKTEDMKGYRMFNAGRVYDDKLLRRKNSQNSGFGFESMGTTNTNSNSQPNKGDLDMDCHTNENKSKSGLNRFSKEAASSKRFVSRAPPTAVSMDYYLSPSVRKFPPRSQSSRMGSSSRQSTNSSIASSSSGGSRNGWKKPIVQGSTTALTSQEETSSSPIKQSIPPKTEAPKEYVLGMGHDSDLGDDSDEDSFGIAGADEEACEDYIQQDLGASMYLEDEEFFDHHIRPHVVDDDVASLDSAIEEQVMAETILQPASSTMKEVLSLSSSLSSIPTNIPAPASKNNQGGSSDDAENDSDCDSFCDATGQDTADMQYLETNLEDSSSTIPTDVPPPGGPNNHGGREYNDESDSDCDSFCDATGQDKADIRYLEKDLGGSCFWGEDCPTLASADHDSVIGSRRGSTVIMTIGEECEDEDDDSTDEMPGECSEGSLVDVVIASISAMISATKSPRAERKEVEYETCQSTEDENKVNEEIKLSGHNYDLHVLPIADTSQDTAAKTDSQTCPSNETENETKDEIKKGSIHNYDLFVPSHDVDPLPFEHPSNVLSVAAMSTRSLSAVEISLSKQKFFDRIPSFGQSNSAHAPMSPLKHTLAPRRRSASALQSTLSKPSMSYRTPAPTLASIPVQRNTVPPQEYMVQLSAHPDIVALDRESSFRPASESDRLSSSSRRSLFGRRSSSRKPSKKPVFASSESDRSLLSRMAYFANSRRNVMHKANSFQLQSNDYPGGMSTTAQSSNPSVAVHTSNPVVMRKANSFQAKSNNVPSVEQKRTPVVVNSISTPPKRRINLRKLFGLSTKAEI